VVSLGLTCALQYWMTRTRPRFGFDRAVATSLVRFGVPLAMANLVSWVVMNSACVVVGWHSGPLLLGFYVLAFNMASWPMTSIGLALRVVALPAFSHLPPDRRAAALRPAMALSWSLALLVGVVLSALASALIGIVYGDKWLPAAAALTGLALFGAQRVLFDLLASFLIAAGAIRQVFVVQLVWLVALIPGLLLGLDLGGLAGAAWAPAVVGVAVAVPAYLVAVRGQGVRLGPVIVAVAFPVLVGAPTLLLSSAIADALSSRWLAVFLVGVTATALYGAVLLPWLRRQVAAVRTITDVGLADDESARDGEVRA
jgi:PST family polysaccharide transporter